MVDGVCAEGVGQSRCWRGGGGGDLMVVDDV